MRYKERDALVESLRKLADFLEDRGVEMPVNDITLAATIYLPYYQRQTFEQLSAKEKKSITKQMVRILKPVKKDYQGTQLTISRQFGTKLNLRMSVAREVVCKAVKTGNKIVHAAHYSPEIVEEEVEWVCTDPLLNAS